MILCILGKINMSKLILINGFCPHWTECENAMSLICYEAVTDDCFEPNEEISLENSYRIEIIPKN